MVVVDLISQQRHQHASVSSSFKRLRRRGSALVDVGAAMGAGFAAVGCLRPRAATVPHMQTTAVTNHARTHRLSLVDDRLSSAGDGRPAG
jgi:hypothetical protein